MRPPRHLLAALPILVLLAGCGGSSSSSSSKSPSTSASPTSTAATSTTAATRSAASSTATATSMATGSATSSPSTGNGSGGAGLTGSATTTAQTAPARIPATFQLQAGGRLSPSTVSIPAFLAVDLSVASHDGAGHTVTVRIPSARTLTIGPHGHAAVLLRGLRAGQYAILVDGHPRGTLSIGGEPGP